MVGHPGETKEAFQELLDFVRETRFERMVPLPIQKKREHIVLVIIKMRFLQKKSREDSMN